MNDGDIEYLGRSIKGPWRLGSGEADGLVMVPRAAACSRA